MRLSKYATVNLVFSKWVGMLIVNNDIDFEQTFNGFDCCTFVKDTKYRYTFVNDAVCQLFGITKEQILGKTDIEFFDLDVNNDLHKNDEIVLRGTPISKMEKNILKNQQIKYFQVVKSPLFSHDGSIKGLLGIATDISNTVTKLSELEFLAMHDPLTGVFNRGYLDIHLKKIVSAHTRHKRHLSIMMIDVDSFKFINDNYGHAIGDEVLKEIGALLMKLVRDSDTCCRYGGDEFTIFLPDTKLPEAFLLAERIRKQISDFKFIDSVKDLVPLETQVSIGIACLNDSEASTLMHQADLALLQAKHQNKNTSIVNCEIQNEIRSCNDCLLFTNCINGSKHNTTFYKV